MPVLSVLVYEVKQNYTKFCLNITGLLICSNSLTPKQTTKKNKTKTKPNQTKQKKKTKPKPPDI